jgi:stage II sporulation protein D
MSLRRLFKNNSWKPAKIFHMILFISLSINLYSFDPDDIRVRILEKHHPTAVTITGCELCEPILIDNQADFPVEFPFSKRLTIGIPGSDLQRSYKGSLLLEWDKNELLIINSLPLEDYVTSVVLSEMGYNKTEAMRAQAVLSRTWAVAHRRSAFLYDCDDLTGSQVYKGLFPQSTKTRRQLAETSGQILTYQGKPVEVFYHAACSHRVFSAYEIWGNKGIPYLQKKELPQALTQNRTGNTWQRVLSKQTVADIFSGVIKTAPPYRYKKAIRDGKLGVYINECWMGIDDFRLKIDRVLGWHCVRSNDFTIQTTGDNLVLQGRGFGHLVGMGQQDAILLAEAGYDYLKILNLFYPGCHIRPLTSLPPR